MTPRQSEIAADAYAASVLARSGYQVSVQYGANQPDYDLVAEKVGRILLVSVKGKQDHGWPLAVAHKKTGISYHQAIDNWKAKQRDDFVFSFVQFLGIPLTSAPRIYAARPDEVAKYMKSQCDGKGHGALWEDYPRDHPHSAYTHRIPQSWDFTQVRIDSI